LHIAEVSQTLVERLRITSAHLGYRGKHMSYSPDLAWLLGSGAVRQVERSTVNCSYKIATPYSIISSASAGSAAAPVGFPRP
jgi:hypothetical protein